MTNSQEGDNGSQAQIMPPGTISQNVPDTPPPAFESDSYNKAVAPPTTQPEYIAPMDFSSSSGKSKRKHKPIDWLAVASASARTGLIAVSWVCVVLFGGLFIAIAGTLLINRVWSFGAVGKIGSVLILIALIGAGAGGWNSYNKQRNP